MDKFSPMDKFLKNIERQKVKFGFQSYVITVMAAIMMLLVLKEIPTANQQILTVLGALFFNTCASILGAKKDTLPEKNENAINQKYEQENDATK